MRRTSARSRSTCAADCGVTISFDTALAAGQSLIVGINTDANANTGLRDGSGADRILTVRDGQATLGG